jgi:hypothetical protein
MRKVQASDRSRPMRVPICGRIAPHLPVREHFVGTSEIEATIAKWRFIFP